MKKVLIKYSFIMAILFLGACGQYTDDQKNAATPNYTAQNYNPTPYPSQPTPPLPNGSSNSNNYSCNALESFVDTATSYEACNSWLLKLMDQCNIQYFESPCLRFQRPAPNPISADSCRTDADCPGVMQCMSAGWAQNLNGNWTYLGKSCGIIN